MATAGNRKRRGFAKAAVQTVSLLLFGSAGISPSEAQPEWSAPPPACIYTAIEGGMTLCIRKDSYEGDLCTAIDRFAVAYGLPADYFARLIWRESAFKANAISIKGARGIAQFMPGTARLRRLDDSYDALQALQKAAEYLAELRSRFGNLGFAAAAYNAGEGGLATYLDTGSLPGETRRYVLAVTGHTIEEWKDKPPEVAAPPLDSSKPFVESCTALVSGRRLKDAVLQQDRPWAPWGAQLAEHFDVAVARRLFFDSARRLPEPLNGELPLIVRQRNADFGFRPRYAARIGRATRAEANAACAIVRQNGRTCLVFRN